MSRGVYLIHFDPPYRHARHYLGYADDISRRVAQHRAGEGARLTQIAVEAGCELILAHVWEGEDRHFERSLKKQKNGPRFCPVCNQIHLIQERDHE